MNDRSWTPKSSVTTCKCTFQGRCVHMMQVRQLDLAHALDEIDCRRRLRAGNIPRCVRKRMPLMPRQGNIPAWHAITPPPFWYQTDMETTTLPLARPEKLRLAASSASARGWMLSMIGLSLPSSIHDRSVFRSAPLGIKNM